MPAQSKKTHARSTILAFNGKSDAFLRPYTPFPNMSTEKQVIPEKYDVEHLEHDGTTPALYATDTTASGSGSATPPVHGDAAYEKRLIRKIDLRLLIILGAIYSISLIDRTNLSTVRVAGAAKDLKLTVGERYSLISLVFFLPYIVSGTVSRKTIFQRDTLLHYSLQSSALHEHSMHPACTPPPAKPITASKPRLAPS